ncbi:MAG: response regulator transcription factor [Pseudomonadota bacterium]|nr:response regulator transcription factor [Pseudomonadota bacterium]
MQVLPMSESLDQTRILIVDDDEALRGLIAEFLRGHGFRVSEADGGAGMRQVMSNEPIDLVILDVMMPGENGLSLARSMALNAGAAIIMVSALGSETDRIIGLEVGADDYLAKPVSPRELVARIRAVLRRRQSTVTVEEGRSAYYFEDWKFDVVRRVLRNPKDVLVSLSEGEFSLLRAFVERPQRVLNRDQLLEFARGPESESFDRAIDTQISRLRRKLSTVSRGELIRTIRGEGYMFLPKVARRP